MRRRERAARRRLGVLLGILVTGLLIGAGWWQAHARRTGVPSPIEQLLTECLAPSLRLTGALRNGMAADEPTSTAPLTPVGLARLRQVEAENAQLRRLLALRDAEIGVAIPAEVIGRSLSPWQGYLLLGKGKADGILPHMVVLTPNGVLGQVASVTPHTARVLPLTDPASGIGAMTERTRAMGVLKGDRHGACRLIYLPGNADVRVGDRVVTSGLGRIFPKAS